MSPFSQIEVLGICNIGTPTPVILATLNPEWLQYLNEIVANEEIENDGKPKSPSNFR